MIVVFEGLHGCGKTTQIDVLSEHLKSLGMNNIIISSWNSHYLINPVLNTMKSKQIGENFSLALAHALDFNLRIEEIRKKAKTSFVIFDRYIYTAFARDCSRGIDRNVVEVLYSNYIEPDIVFFLDIPVSLSVQRVINGKDTRSDYITGRDLYPDKNDCESMLHYFESQREVYINMLTQKENSYLVNAERSIDAQKKYIWDRIKRRIKINKKAEDSNEKRS